MPDIRSCGGLGPCAHNPRYVKYRTARLESRQKSVWNLTPPNLVWMWGGSILGVDLTWQSEM